jgi:spermidine/putrescine transport system permease protein
LARGGPLEWAFNALHLHSGPLDLLDTQTAVFIGIVYAYMPIAIVPLVLVISRIAPDYAEASSDLGASRWSTFWNITLPLSRPGIATAALLTAVPMLGELVIPMLLGGDKGVLIGMAIASQYLGAQNYPVGSAMAVLILLAAGIILAGLSKATGSFEELGV